MLHHMLRAAAGNRGSYALSFDGVDDYVTTPVSDFAGSITLEVTINLSAYNTIDRTHAHIIRASDTFLIINADANGLWFRIAKSGISYDLKGGNINLNTDHHCAAVYDETGMYIYIDGVLVVSDTSMSGPKDNTGASFALGTNGAELDGGYDGIQRDARIWSVARTQAEIQDNMNKSLQGNETGLVAYYPMKEGSGTTLYDYAGTNDGTINGATWIEL